MKRSLRIIAALLALCLCLSVLAACKEEPDYAILVGNQKVSENTYRRNMLYFRGNYLTSLGEEDSASIWKQKNDAGTTVSAFLAEQVQDYIIEQKLYAEQFDRLGLSFTEEEEKTIRRAISEQVEANGGMSSFEELLAQQNYTYDEYCETVYDNTKRSRVLRYYFGEDGQKPVKLQDIKDYYNVHNARVKMILIQKTDGVTGEMLSDAQIAELRTKADNAYEAASRKNELDTFDDLITLYSDDRSTRGDGIVYSDTATYEDEATAELVKMFFEMELGEVRRYESKDAFLIIKRYDGTTDDVFTASIQQATLEVIRADEIAELLAQWKEEITVKLNKEAIKRNAPEKFVEE